MYRFTWIVFSKLFFHIVFFFIFLYAFKNKLYSAFNIVYWKYISYISVTKMKVMNMGFKYFNRAFVIILMVTVLVLLNGLRAIVWYFTFKLLLKGKLKLRCFTEKNIQNDCLCKYEYKELKQVFKDDKHKSLFMFAVHMIFWLYLWN